MNAPINRTTHTPEYAALQSEFHRQRPDYGISGERYAEHIRQLAAKMQTRDILDYGCGKATLQKSLPFPIHNYDPFIPEFATSPEPADIVVCTDVMEHIEPQFIANTLKDIAALTKQVAFFQIATRPASKVLPDGRNAHLVVQPINWWLAELMPFFSIMALTDLGGGFICIGTPFVPEAAC